MSVARDKITVIDGGKDGGRGGGQVPTGDWRDKLTRTQKGRVEATAHNLLLVLEHDPDLHALFRLDEFANRVVLTRDAPWPGGTRDEFTDLDGTELAAWLSDPAHYSLPAKKDSVMDAVEAIARRRAFHPVREYLESLEWDGTPRIDGMLSDLFGADNASYVRGASRCMMIGAVARILWVDPQVAHNGAKVDFMVILEGNQGRGKGTGLGTLCGWQWFGEQQESPQSKDFYQVLRGRWLVEIAEMESFSKADVKKVKSAITARFDTYRPSYGRIARSFRRECVFAGTTNDEEYLRDPTGARRFLPVRVNRDVDVAGIARDRDQLWAEATARFRKGERWWELPAGAAMEQEKRYQADSWEELIVPWLAGKAAKERYPTRLVLNEAPTWTTTTEILSWCLGVDTAKHTRQDQMRVGHIMHRIGWKGDRPTIDGVRQRIWVRKHGEGGDDDVPF